MGNITDISFLDFFYTVSYEYELIENVYEEAKCSIIRINATKQEIFCAKRDSSNQSPEFSGQIIRQIGVAPRPGIRRCAQNLEWDDR
jgi:hypothetical protein